jgi:ABC-2 type transport system permease protein
LNGGEESGMADDPVIEVRGIMLRGYGVGETLWHLWPILLFTGMVVVLGSRFYKRPLD